MKKRILIAILFLSVLSMLSWSVAAGPPTGYCGNGIINLGETCEGPGTTENSYCPESATTCSGRMMGVRPYEGDCNTLCKCNYYDFTYSCVKDECGAQCETKEDCPQAAEKCVGSKLSVRAEFGMCHYNCNCQETPFGPAKCIKNECGAECSKNSDCTQSTTGACLGAKTGTRKAAGKCNSADCQCIETPFNYKCVADSCGAECAKSSDCKEDLTKCNYETNKLGTRTATCKNDCMCKYNPYAYKCVKGQCGATCSKDADCDDGNTNTKDQCINNCTCTHTPIARCGDGIVGFGEQCEYPNTLNNYYCEESVNECKGRMHGERVPYGDCNSKCQCVLKPLVYSCVIGYCGAQCETQADCPQTTKKCVGKMLSVRPEFATCHYNCNCQETPFEPAKCVKNECGAQCAKNSDCSENETCLGCMCV